MCVLPQFKKRTPHAEVYEIKNTRDKEILKTAGEEGSQIVLLRIN